MNVCTTFYGNPSNRFWYIIKWKLYLLLVWDGKVRGWIKSVGLIVWWPWMSIQNIMSIYPKFVKMFQSGPTKQMTDITIHYPEPISNNKKGCFQKKWGNMYAQGLRLRTVFEREERQSSSGGRKRPYHRWTASWWVFFAFPFSVFSEKILHCLNSRCR